MIEDTIVAIATPIGKGGVGIVRLSGQQSVAIAEALFSVSIKKPRYVYFGAFSYQQADLDEGCVIYFKGPHSYTGEDVVEFQVHGSAYVLRTLVAWSLSLGARLAGPGEFTRRAFLNGRMDLTKAESVIDLIDSESEKSHFVSLSHVKGTLYNYVQTVRESLLNLLEQLEGSIDFPDEVPALPRDTVSRILEKNLVQLEKVITLQDFGEYVSRGVQCVIVGPPNVGKSSLLNALLGQERAIVTDVPGTTRDYIQAQISLGGISFNFFDTAGVRQSEDAIERIGVQKGQELLSKADVVLWMVDGSRPSSDSDTAVYEVIKQFSMIYRLQNKQDLQGFSKSSELFPVHRDLFVSAKTGEGLDQLKQFLYEDFVENIEKSDLDLLCNIRQIECLKVSVSFIENCNQSLKEGIEDAVLGLDLRQAILKLGEITGDEVTEEVLDGIFSRFCVGK